jgi:DNA-binding response OmpR family regulator
MASSSGEAGPMRVLLVEDEALIALDMQDALEAAGHVVAAIADRVDSAAELANTGAFDIAVLDVHLDGVQIWPVAEILRERGIPLILLTGLLSTADVPASCAAAPRLAKPVDQSALLETVATLVKKTRPTSD